MLATNKIIWLIAEVLTVLGAIGLRVTKRAVT